MDDRVAAALVIAVFGLGFVAAGAIGVVKTRSVEPLSWGNSQADVARVLLGVVIFLSASLDIIERAYWWWWASLIGLFVAVWIYHYIRYGFDEKPDTMSGVLSGAGLSAAAAAPLGCAAEVLIVSVAFLVIGLVYGLFQLLFG